MRSLQSMIREATEALSARGISFSANDVLDYMSEHFGNDMSQHNAKLARGELKRRINGELKKGTGQEFGVEGEQMVLAGMEVPKNIPFKDFETGEVIYLSTLACRLEHIESAISLREDHIAFSRAKIADLRKITDWLRRHDDNPTLAEALKREYGTNAVAGGEDRASV
jgi:hypothetical protein